MLINIALAAAIRYSTSTNKRLRASIPRTMRMHGIQKSEAIRKLMNGFFYFACLLTTSFPAKLVACFEALSAGNRDIAQVAKTSLAVELFRYIRSPFSRISDQP